VAWGLQEFITENCQYLGSDQDNSVHLSSSCSGVGAAAILGCSYTACAALVEL